MGNELVRDFVTEVTSGMSVRLVDAETGLFSVNTLVVHENLETLSVTADSAQTEESGAKQQSFVNIRMKDVRALYSGNFSLNKTELTADLQPKCIGMDIKEPDSVVHLLFYFEDDTARHRFFTCMKILRSNVDRMR